MESQPIKIVLTPAEKIDVVRRKIKDKQKELDEAERKIRELKREDAEMAYLCTFIGAEYINPQGQNNSAALQPLEQERELLVYLITQLNGQLSSLMGGGAPAAAPQAQQNQGGAKWGK